MQDMVTESLSESVRHFNIIHDVISNHKPTREAMWQSEDPERLQTYMKVSAVPTYRTQLGENEETHVTFLLPQYNRTWAA